MNLTTKELSILIDNFFSTCNKINSSNDAIVKNIHLHLNKNKINFSLDSLLTTFNSYKLDFKTLTKKNIKVLFYILCGSSKAKAKFAFQLIDKDKTKKIKSIRLKNIFKLIGIDETSIDKLLLELSQDGSEEITESNFVNFLPQDFNSHPKTYKSIHKHVIGNSILFNKELKESKKNPIKFHTFRGTSTLQLQIGFFRLLQGAAYRSFRESFSANCETHLRAYDLPYSVKEFVSFVQSFVEYYLSLGIVQEEVYSVFDDLVNSALKLEKELQYRMENWHIVQKSNEMIFAEKNLEREFDELENHHQLLSFLIELILSASLHGHDAENINIEELEFHELNRLRHLELKFELTDSKNNSASSSKKISFLDSWQRVIYDSSNTFYEGSIIPTSYWYQEFMPLLLKASAIVDKNDLIKWETTSEEKLDNWFNTLNQKKEFDNYAKDLKEYFPKLSRDKKILMRQSWVLSRHYLNGVQKRRERLEFGRESGYLSQYVAFIDTELGRDDVEKSQMRLSFPYFIGPSTWKFLHTSAEIIKKKEKNNEYDSVGKFKKFFKSLATMYPCPYCRYHLNKFVVKNKEVAMYPIEYLLIGTKNEFNFDINIEQKISSINDGQSLSLFLWKLHNTVSSSIARSEEWFHLDKSSYYTSRYWPGLDSELERAKLLSISSISTEIISRIYGIIRHAIKLSTLKDELKLYLETNQSTSQIYNKSIESSKEIDDALISSNYLESHYFFNPLLEDEDPHFSVAEESLARSGKFTLE